ncbi:gamma-glutamyltransferase [Salinisphaera orenii]|uniref:gamma-glutamyltransferase n=1 Tax=Salinisphaera orenii TaxID=856731 RepID=UPI0014748F53
MRTGNTPWYNLTSAAAGIVLLLAASIQASATPNKAAVASAHPAATQAGQTILQRGGNAFDAAVAVSAALAVVEPQSSGLGGGGFWLLHQNESGRNIMIDGREEAPAAATPRMYQNADGEIKKRASRDGGLAAGIPGEPAALVHLAQNYGQLSLAEDLAPAIELAQNGVPVNADMHHLANFRKDLLKRYPASADKILTKAGEPLPVGTSLVQPQLAETLQSLAQDGKAGFYDGPVAAKLVAGNRSAGGIWTRKDLSDYSVVEREPMSGQYKTPAGQFKVVSAGPPSAGGIELLETLNILSGYQWSKLDRTHRVHLAAEAMRRAYRDRAAYLGDADFVDMPLAKLTDPHYAAGLRASITKDQATPSDALAPVTSAYRRQRGTDTTHFSIVDSAGNRVAATLSINFPFGSGVVAPGTGVFLNDEMDDFAAKPLTPNGYGLVSTRANQVEPGKRPLSSMSPTFVTGPEKTLIVGTPGGSRIISMVLLGILDFTHGGNAQDVVQHGRYHHQYLPDAIQYEPGALSPKVRHQLEAMGHSFKKVDHHYGDMHAIVVNHDNGQLNAASDPRGIGCAAVGTGGHSCALGDAIDADNRNAETH